MLGFLTFLVTTTILVLQQDVETSGSRQLVSRARQLAEMGLAVASHPGVQQDDPLLLGSISNTESYEAIITSEEGRLNLNFLLTEERRVVLERIFQNWGLDPLAAESLVDALMDWVDADDFKRLHGAESDEYRQLGIKGRPFNRPFASMDEVSLVLGIEQLEKVHPAWRDEFTVLGQGPLDLNEASAARIALLADVPEQNAQQLVERRAGPDGQPHTPDDVPFQSVEEALALLGVTGDTATRLATLFTIKGNTVRIESVGRVAGYERGIAVVLQKSTGAGARVLAWKEFVPEH